MSLHFDLVDEFRIRGGGCCERRSSTSFYLKMFRSDVSHNSFKKTREAFFYTLLQLIPTKICSENGGYDVVFSFRKRICSDASILYIL